MIVVDWQECLYLFDSEFDEARDEYSECFTVYQLEESARHLVNDPSWSALANTGSVIGSVPVAAVRFDESRRNAICSSVFALVAE